MAIIQQQDHLIKKRPPNWKGGRIISRGYKYIACPNHPRATKTGYVLEDILKIENILGKQLQDRAVIHHHTPEQLVVCQNQSYHLLLHQRTRAFKECGHASWRKCPYCKQYDDPSNLFVSSIPGQSAYHRHCRNEFDRNRRRKKRLKAIEFYEKN